MSVKQLLRRVDSRELTEWQVYSEIEPFGEERDDLRAGIIASVIANSNRDPKQKPTAYKPQDFMPRFDRFEESSMQVAPGTADLYDGDVEERPTQSPEDMLEVFQAMVQAFAAMPAEPESEPVAGELNGHSGHTNGSVPG